MRIRNFFGLSIVLIFFAFFNLAISKDIEFKTDNGEPEGDAYRINRRFFEESVVLQPDGPCQIKTIRVYYSGEEPGKDTLWICGYPTAGNLYPTQYIWDYNSLIPPIEIEYDGNPGWMDIDVSGTGLRSDGYDKIVIQHRMKPDGPWFTYDSDGRQSMPSSWICDPFTPNSNFFGIRGTIYHNPGGDYLVRLILEYDFPEGNTSAPPPPPTMVDITGEMSLNPHRYSSVSDLNKDGFDDIILAGRVYINSPNEPFDQIANISAAGTTIADIDNDGDMDVYALANGSKDFDKRMVLNNDAIFLNEGDMNFAKIPNNNIFNPPYPDPAVDFALNEPTDQKKYFNPYETITPLFFDYNKDGWLDLFIANRRIEIGGKPELYCPDQLWQNNGDGTFKNVRESSGIADGEPFTPYQPGMYGYGYYDCYGACATDYNNDNEIDVFVANYRLQKDNLYENKGDGTFNEVGAETGVQGIPTSSPGYFGHGMGCQWGDFNNDAFPDLCVGNLAHTDSRGAASNPSLIFRNDGPPEYHFTNVQPEMVLKFHEGNAGVLWLDLNCDGLLDLWHGKYSGGFGSFYLNTGPPDYKLREITWKIGAIVNNSWTASKLDHDNDGDLDMIIQGRLFRNDIPREGKWLAVRLTGNPADNVSLDCFGTKVICYAGDMKFYRELMGSASGTLCTQNTNELHFGLGDVENIDSLVVIYPNGNVNKIEDVVPNSRYVIPYMEEPDFSPISTPALISPMNFTIIKKDSIIFKWTELGWAEEYNLRVYQKDKDGNIINLMEVNDLTETEHGVDITEDETFESGETYFWDVNAVFKNEGSTELITAHYSSTYVYSIGTPKPQSVSLIQPEDGSSGILPQTEFIWSKAKYLNKYAEVETLYNLQISHDENFNDIAIDLKDLENVNISNVEGLVPGNSYYWRVRAYNKEWYSEWSQTYYFEMLALPAQPILKSPENHATDVDLRPNMEWEEIPHTDKYLIEISQVPGFDDIFYDITSSFTKVKVIKKHEEGTKYYWRVRGENDAGNGAWSEIWDYTTEGETDVEYFASKTNDIVCLPNPFSEEVDIYISVELPQNIELSVYNVFGDKIETLINNVYTEKQHIKWHPEKLNSGLYLLKLKSKKGILTKKLYYIH